MSLRLAGTIVFVCGLSAAAPLAQQQEPAQKKPKATTGTPPAAAKALEHYAFTCQPCHGPGGKGVLPDTDFTDGKWKHGSSLDAVAKIIGEGVPGTTMLPAKDRFSKAEILELARLVRSFDKSLAGRKRPVKK